MTKKEQYLNDVKENVEYAIKTYFEYDLPKYTNFTIVNSFQEGMLIRYESETIDTINKVFEEHKQLAWWFSPYSKNDIQIF